MSTDPHHTHVYVAASDDLGDHGKHTDEGND